MTDGPTISAEQCIDALRIAGFHVRSYGAGGTVLARDGRFVLVPNALVLPPSVLDAILDEADLSITRLLYLLEEAPTLVE